MKKNTVLKIITISILLLFAAITVLPFFLMIATSSKNQFEFATNFWGMKIPMEWNNYVVAWGAIERYIFNSFKLAFLYVLGNGILSIMAAYAFAKKQFKGKEFLYTLLLSFQMIPAALILIPQFMNVYELGLYNTHAGVVLPTVGAGSIVATILARSFFEGIPDSIFESAKIDGASESTIIIKILMPLAKPIIGTNALFAFFASFNNYMWPFLILSDEKLKTIPIGLSTLSGQYGVNYGVQMAAYSIICIPLMILIMCTMKTYIGGLTNGSVKG